MKTKVIFGILIVFIILFGSGLVIAEDLHLGEVNLFVLNPSVSPMLNMTFNMTQYLVPTGQNYNATISLASSGLLINQTISNASQISFSLPSAEYNLRVNAFNSSVQARLNNFSVSSNSVHNFSIDYVNLSRNTLAGYLSVYEISSTIVSGSANVWINYSRLGYTNEDNIQLSVCTNWNRLLGECSGQWGELFESIDKTGKIITASSSISATTAFAIAEVSSSSAETGTSGGGGDSRAVPLLLTTTPSELNIHAILGESEINTIKVKSLADIPMTFDVVIRGDEIEGVLNTLTRISLQPGEEKSMDISVNALDRNLLSGIILFRTRNYEYELPVVINVKSKNFLFDVSISVFEQFKRVYSGTPVRVQANLLQVGPKEAVDVLATYVIKDYLGNVHLEEKETFAVLREKSYVKEFSTAGLLPGKYIVGLEIIYPSEFATASSSFEIIQEKSSKIKLVLIGLTVFVVLFGAWAAMRYGLKKRGRKV